MSSEVSERARVIERTLLESVTYSDDAQRVPALQYISNRAFAIAAAIEAALSAPPIDDELVARLRELANQIDPCLVGGPDARLLRQAADRIAAAGEVRREPYKRALWIEFDGKTPTAAVYEEDGREVMRCQISLSAKEESR